MLDAAGVYFKLLLETMTSIGNRLLLLGPIGINLLL